MKISGEAERLQRFCVVFMAVLTSTTGSTNACLLGTSLNSELSVSSATNDSQTDMPLDVLLSAYTPGDQPKNSKQACLLLLW